MTLPRNLALALTVGVGLTLAGSTACRTAPAATPEHGEVLYSNYCAQCHGGEGHGTQLIGAPAIASLPEWYLVEQLTKFRAGTRAYHFDDLEGMRMRPMALTLKAEEDVMAVAMYVARLKAPPAAAATLHGDASAGAASFALCSTCHGVDGKGNEQLGAPSLLTQQDWYVARQLGKFKAGVRGAHPDDVRGAQMRPMAMTLADDAAIQNVVAHIQTLHAGAGASDHGK